MEKAKKEPKRMIATCKVGTKGQIVIPDGVRKMFDINPGDSLVILADSKRGIALVKEGVILSLTGKVVGK